MDIKRIIIGIDLGTTNSLVSYWTPEGSVIIPNSLGQNFTPSVISLDENGQVLVGQVAKERQMSHPELSVSFANINPDEVVAVGAGIQAAFTPLINKARP